MSRAMPENEIPPARRVDIYFASILLLSSVFWKIKLALEYISSLIYPMLLAVNYNCGGDGSYYFIAHLSFKMVPF